MTNNDVLRRLRYLLNLKDNQVIKIFSLVKVSVTDSQVISWLKKDDEPDMLPIMDVELAQFLNGLIIFKRGHKDGPLPAAESELNYNLILRKLKIAFNLQAEEIIELVKHNGLEIGKSELSAFFRKPEHKHYRSCKEQFLRHFINGLQAKLSSEHQAKVKPANKSFNNDKKSSNVGKLSTEKAGKTTKQIYINPNAKSKPQESDKGSTSTRKTLKLSAKEIWKNSQ